MCRKPEGSGLPQRIKGSRHVAWEESEELPGNSGSCRRQATSQSLSFPSCGMGWQPWGGGLLGGVWRWSHPSSQEVALDSEW